MKDKKGQALVEFIIILPIMLLLIVASIDFGNIIYQQYHLENDLDVVSNLYTQNKKSRINEYIRQKNLSISYNTIDELTTITLSKKIKVTAPIVSNIFGNPYIIKVDRTVYE